MTPDDIQVEKDPKPDERSAQEQAAANAAWKAYGGPVKGVFVLDNGEAAGEHRQMHVYFWVGWLHQRRLRKAQSAMEAAVRAVVGPVGKVIVGPVPAEVLRKAKDEP